MPLFTEWPRDGVLGNPSPSAPTLPMLRPAVLRYQVMPRLPKRGSGEPKSRPFTAASPREKVVHKLLGLLYLCSGFSSFQR